MARGSDSLFLRSGSAGLRAWTPSDDQRKKELERQAAALTVACNATGHDDCLELLSMLGLMPDPDDTPPE